MSTIVGFKKSTFEPLADDGAPDFLKRELGDGEFDDYVRACNSDLPIDEVAFFLPDFVDS